MFSSRHLFVMALFFAAASCGGSAKIDGGEPGGAGQGAGGAGSNGGAAGSMHPGGVAGSGFAGSSSAGSSAGGAPGCISNGVSHAFGEKFACDCNTCWCNPDGSISSTAIACATCTYQGQGRFGGESFPDKDGCNTCTCEDDGSVACTDKACACNPDVEYWRHYVADPNTCALADLACPENTKGFGNECGCGCEQAESCPEWVNCQPGAGANCDELLAKCPYSKVAQ